MPEGGVKITLSPAKADPFDGHFEMTSEALAGRGPVHLEMDGVAPETAARVTINGQYAGGAIGKPMRLEISKHLRAGKNTLRIEPFAPKTITLVVYE